MVTNDRNSRSRLPRLESLEDRNLLSLIGSKPTLDAVDGPGVHHLRMGGISIVQPAAIQVFGTAQPGAPGTNVQVGIFAADSEGNLVNGGAPLATTTPNLLGQFRAVVALPSMLRKDVNFLVARETASATQTSNLAINGTTISGLNGSLSLNPGTLSGLDATVANPANTLSGFTATTNTPAGTLTGLGGTISTPATPISNIAGTITTPVFPSGSGTAGPATSTLLGGSGTLNAQVATLSGGSGTLSAATGTITNGTGNLGATTSTLTQQGDATESSRTGALSNGTGTIAATTGTATQQVQEVATSDPLTVYIHQSRAFPGPIVPLTAARPHVSAVAQGLHSAGGHHLHATGGHHLHTRHHRG